MTKTKICYNCKLTKNIDEFVTRNQKTNSEYDKKVLSLCKSCNAYLAKQHYYSKKNKKYYLYRFLGKEDNIIYIGKTSNLENRIRRHILGSGGLSEECYKKLFKIQVLEFESQALRDINEIYYINIFKPPYNKEFNYNEAPVYIKGLGYEEWIDLDIESIYNWNYKDLEHLENKNIENNMNFNLELKIDQSKLYVGKAIIFIRERNGKFFIYAEYFDSIKNKKRQVKLSEFDNRNIALCELEDLKAKKKNGKYTIYLGGNIVI